MTVVYTRGRVGGGNKVQVRTRDVFQNHSYFRIRLKREGLGLIQKLPGLISFFFFFLCKIFFYNDI